MLDTLIREAFAQISKNKTATKVCNNIKVGLKASNHVVALNELIVCQRLMKLLAFVWGHIKPIVSIQNFV